MLSVTPSGMQNSSGDGASYSLLSFSGHIAPLLETVGHKLFPNGEAIDLLDYDSVRTNAISILCEMVCGQKLETHEIETFSCWINQGKLP